MKSVMALLITINFSLITAGCGLLGTDFEVNRRAKIQREAYMKAHPDYVPPEEYSMFGPLPDKR